ncbi:hypothetical protein SAMN04515674_102174 [Pseudarcicella hirudinis]|uniref:Uncharacterized protein n=1 Tax=Pseudarcicella hirudinis TaxID=1079859 RepID=A0A1I5NY39_9BACT|nr:hypothetical protein [Pseudarcicella hirudinis]SFP26714.1 hypothetical protein SAMN04515674_102174 [Pseudarcicella hirudinis]
MPKPPDNLVDEFKSVISNDIISPGTDKTLEEYKLYEEGRQQAEVDKLKTEVDEAKQNLTERKKYAFWIFWMVVGWLLVILGIIIFVGFKKIELSDSVILALIGSTTVNVTTFFLAVIKYLFPTK